MHTKLMNHVIRSLFFALLLLGVSGAAFAQISVGISVNFAPPALPVYEQPVCPGDGYIWTPGYWAWDGFEYYWVPGTWVLAPRVGFLWTPAWWGWSGGVYVFHPGYWGPHVGWYGGISYGFGYFGHGFEGGRWDGGHFFYNREVTNVNVTVIHNVYNTRIENTTINHVSYNGGPGGISARATPEEEAYSRERHIGPVAAQTQHMEAARANPQMRASENHGKPPIAATARPGAFNEREAVTPAREAGGHYEPPANRGAAAVHPHELGLYSRPAAPNTGNRNQDQKYQQQQQQLYAKQYQERQKLQQQQEKEHENLTRQNASEQQRQQLEQRHQQQTQQMYQRHVQEQQQMQQKQAPHQTEERRH